MSEQYDPRIIDGLNTAMNPLAADLTTYWPDVQKLQAGLQGQSQQVA